MGDLSQSNVLGLGRQRARHRPRTFVSGAGQQSQCREEESRKKDDCELRSPPAGRRARPSVHLGPSPRDCSPTQKDSAGESDDEEMAPAASPEEEHPAPRPAPPPPRPHARPPIVPPRYPDKVGTGVNTFNLWWHDRMDIPDTLANRALPEPLNIMQEMEMTRALAPIDLVAEIRSHHRRAKVFKAWIPEMKKADGSAVGHSSIKGYLGNCQVYLHHCQKQDETLEQCMGEWSFRRSHVYSEVMKEEAEFKKRENGFAGVGRNLGDNSKEIIESILDAHKHHQSILFPEHVELFRMYWRGMAARLQDSNYMVKIKDMAQRGSKDSYKPFSDWIHCQQQLFMIDIGSNGGRRAFTGYRKATIDSIAACYWDGRPLGLWNVDAYIQKHSGHSRRAPYFILDAGVNTGCVRRFELLKSKRGKHLSTGSSGEGEHACKCLSAICRAPPHPRSLFPAVPPRRRAL